MFAWLARQKKREVLKLLFQNFSFLKMHTVVHSSDEDAQIWLKTTTEINESFFEQGSIDEDSLKFLFDVNRKIRVFFDQNDPAQKIHKTGLTTKKPEGFDQKFQPKLGWKDYYKEHGL